LSSSNYKYLNIKSCNTSERINWKSIIDFITDLNDLNTNESNKFVNKLKENIKLTYFSKFSKCLSDQLLAESLLERSFDFKGLQSELQNNDIRVIKNDDI
jgi:hypothetical protein